MGGWGRDGGGEPPGGVGAARCQGRQQGPVPLRQEPGRSGM